MVRLPWRRRPVSSCVYCAIEEKGYRQRLNEVAGWSEDEYEALMCPSGHGHFFTDDPGVSTLVLHAWDGK